jgi:hypothetical protein
MSTYSLERAAERWAANQLMLVELAPAASRPRIVRLGSTENRFLSGTKGNVYFTEAFASMGQVGTPAGAAVYWGANWDGADNLELYELRLPAGWETGRQDAEEGQGRQEEGEEEGEAPGPVVTPEPDPEPVVTPTPAAEWMGWRFEGEIRVKRN